MSGRPIDRLVVHPRIGNSLRFRPDDYVDVEILHFDAEECNHTLALEAVRSEPHEESVLVDPGFVRVRVLDYLLQYDFRGSNRFQEEENLTFLRYYLDRYPEVRNYFRADILVPTDWED